uniref:Uncharacterized protein n=1 Tax=Anguilla anguilla TaxID=7936 RepID=A0A0E9QFR2_ANGAN
MTTNDSQLFTQPRITECKFIVS